MEQGLSLAILGGNMCESTHLGRDAPLLQDSSEALENIRFSRATSSDAHSPAIIGEGHCRLLLVDVLLASAQSRWFCQHPPFSFICEAFHTAPASEGLAVEAQR